MSDCHKKIDNTDKIKRLNRISGQVDGIKKMIESQRYCPDIINQILAINAALKSLSGIMLKDHIEGCVYEAFHGNNKKEQDEKLKELMRLFDKAGK